MPSNSQSLSASPLQNSLESLGDQIQVFLGSPSLLCFSVIASNFWEVGGDRRASCPRVLPAEAQVFLGSGQMLPSLLVFYGVLSHPLSLRELKGWGSSDLGTQGPGADTGVQMLRLTPLSKHQPRSAATLHRALTMLPALG